MDTPGACTLSAVIDGEAFWCGAVMPPANDRVLVAILPRPITMQHLALHLTGPGLKVENDYDLAWQPPPASEQQLLSWLRERVKSWVLRW
jgi:hypothetical protein